MDYEQEFLRLLELFSHLRALIECVAELSTETEYIYLKEILYRLSTKELEDVVLSIQKLARYMQYEPEVDSQTVRDLLDLME